ncbi:glycosyltransferase family 2 protein [Plantactinospora sp. GCM10030261]|uniref:glycosyltransferase family 2 protein n=1 Tax=Plantactinospora sp. GCM10030261 TaxID=3273420 RepID=UPI00361D31EB
MITYNRPEYVRLSLPRLLDSCPPDARVWVWHNGTDRPTLDAVRAHEDHPRMHRLWHDPANPGLREPTNWLWQESTGDLLSKVDDDCLEEPDWIDRLRRAHDDVPRFGVIGAWRFPEEDSDPELMAPKLVDYPHGHRLLRNHWVQGSGYLVKRAVIDQAGPLARGQSFTRWCVRAAWMGWINGWYHPFIREDHMDDPRSPHTIYRTDADLMGRRPLSARRVGVTTIAEWTAEQTRSARMVQGASLDFRHHLGWRFHRRNVARRMQQALTGRAPW